jgi:AraC-like DNA-binding protein
MAIPKYDHAFDFFLEPCRLGIADFLEVGSYHMRKAACRIGPHWHSPHRLELTYVLAGRQTHAVNERLFTVPSGHGILIRPGDTHGSVHVVQEPSHVCFVILCADPREKTFLGLLGEDADSLRQSLLRMEPRSFPISSFGLELWKVLFTSLQSLTGSRRPHRVEALTVKGCAVAFLSELVAHASSCCVEGFTPSLVQRIDNYIDKHMDESISIKSLANHVGLSVSHFLVRFKREQGDSIGDYVWRRKIVAARNKIELGETDMTAIGLDLGFSSSQHFSTVFKRYAGVTPTRYRRNPWLWPQDKVPEEPRFGVPQP